MPSLPQFSSVRYPRPLCFSGWFEENYLQWVRGKAEFSCKNSSCTNPWDLTRYILKNHTENTGWWLCKATHYHLWKITNIKRAPGWAEKCRCCNYLKNRPSAYRLLASLCAQPKSWMRPLGTCERDVMNVKMKKVIVNSQCVFIKAKSCLTNLIDFNDKITGFVGKGRE